MVRRPESDKTKELRKIADRLAESFSTVAFMSFPAPTTTLRLISFCTSVTHYGYRLSRVAEKFNSRFVFRQRF